MALKILILYFDKPDRISSKDLLYCYKEFSDSLCYFYSLHRGPIPRYLLNIEFDIIIYHTLFISQRWAGIKYFKETVYPLVEGIRSSKGVKILLPQDEWIHTDVMNDFVNDFNINIIYSVAPESEFGIIYDKVDQKKVEFHKVLTGYLSEPTVDLIKRLSEKVNERTIDVGYRAFRAPPWLGKHGYLKTKIADVFNTEGPKAGLKVDISTKKEDTFFGEEWYKFLLRCKYFIGVEGGATVLDPDGSIWKKGLDHEEKYPNASFEEFERMCFPGMDGNLKLIAISPRHLEAVCSKTCQVLIEGDYNGILKPDLHYIMLKSDFSNLNEVMSKLKDDTLREKIVKRAYKDIVESGEYSYKKYVDFILNTSMKGKTISKTRFVYFISLGINKMAERQIHFKRISKNKTEGAKEEFNSKLKHFVYHFKILPYFILMKMGMKSYKEKISKIRY